MKFLAFSDCSVVSVVLSIFCIVHLYYRRRFIPSNGFMSSRSVMSMVIYLLILLVFASTVSFLTSFAPFLSKSWYGFVFGNFFFSFCHFFFRWYYFNRWSVYAMTSFSVPSIFIVMLTWFFQSVTCFVSFIIFILLSVSISCVFSGSVKSLFFCFF